MCFISNGALAYDNISELRWRQAKIAACVGREFEANPILTKLSREERTIYDNNV